MSNNIKKIVVFTGAGISKESGLSTFRDADGLWNQYPIEEVATIEALYENTAKVLEFYNIRRRKILQAQPNKAHYNLATLEKKYDVLIITQNIDDLHERAGSSKVIHLHGLITQNKCMCPVPHYYNINLENNEGVDIKVGDKCEAGSQLRHNIVLFGEPVENMDIAYNEVSNADVFLVIGTSLQVYPAANLVYHTRSNAFCIYIDPGEALLPRNFVHIKEKATVGVPKIADILLSDPAKLYNIT